MRPDAIPRVTPRRTPTSLALPCPKHDAISGGSPSKASRGYFLDPSDDTGRTDSNHKENFSAPAQDGEITSSHGVTRRTVAPWALRDGAERASSGSESV